MVRTATQKPTLTMATITMAPATPTAMTSGDPTMAPRPRTKTEGPLDLSNRLTRRHSHRHSRRKRDHRR
jgi:hypothetical protein